MKDMNYGPGDPETWSPYCGHPNDPRAPDIPEPSQDLINDVVNELMDDLEEVNSAIGPDAWGVKDYKNNHDAYLERCAEYIASEDWLALGELVGKKARNYLEEKALEQINE